MGDSMDDFTALLSCPVVVITITAGAFLLGQKLYILCKRFPLCHPIVIAAAAVTVFLEASGVSYAEYKNNTSILGMLLGTATVALAVPLYQQLHLIRAYARPLLITLVAGAFFAPASAVLLAWLVGANKTTLLSLAAKSVTTPIAVAVTESIGGIVALAAGVVIVVGIFGALIGPPILDRLNIQDKAVRGFTLGLVSHAVGTARAFELDPVSGAFASLGLALTGALTAIVIPLFWLLF